MTSSAGNPGAGAVAGPTVVVVEDDDSVMRVLTAFLRSVGFRTRGAASAEAMIDSLEWSPAIDCIVSDLRLPKMDGLELLRAVRDRGLDAPFILITGHGDVTLAVEAMKAGASDFIEKPFQPQQLETAVRSAIGRARAAGDRAKEAREARTKLNKLTSRQAEILDLVASGLTSKEIGTELNMSYRTVEAHRISIFDKLDVGSLAELVRMRLLAQLDIDKR